MHPCSARAPHLPLFCAATLLFASMASAASSGFLDDFGDLFPDDDGVFSASSFSAGPDDIDPPAAAAPAPITPPSSSSGRRSRRGAGGHGVGRLDGGGRRPQDAPLVPEWARPPEGRWRGGQYPRAANIVGTANIGNLSVASSGNILTKTLPGHLHNAVLVELVLFN